MPVVILPGAEAPTTLPVTRLKAEVDAGKRVVLPDSDVAISRRPIDVPGGVSADFEYLVEPLDADYVEDGGTMDPGVDNSAFAEHFGTFEEALASVE